VATASTSASTSLGKDSLPMVRVAGELLPPAALVTVVTAITVAVGAEESSVTIATLSGTLLREQ
jgi:hypothetical protein